MERDAVLENVRQALTYEQLLHDLREKMEEIQQIKPTPPKKPAPPRLKEAQFTPLPYPEIPVPDLGPSSWRKRARALAIAGLAVLTIPFILYGIMVTFPTLFGLVLSGSSALGVLFCFFFIGPALLIGALICRIADAFTAGDRHAAYCTRVQATPEYQQMCARTDAANAQAYQRAQAQAQQAHQQALQQYETVTLPAYQADLERFEKEIYPKWTSAVKHCQNAMRLGEEELKRIYAAKIISEDYRTILALTFIASYLGSSQASLSEAIAQYDAKVTNDLLRQTMSMYQNQAQAMQDMIEEQAMALDDLGDQLEDVHKEARNSKRWSIAGTALAGYGAYKTRKIGKELEEESD